MALMKTVTITQLKNQLSALIRLVRGGDVVLVLDRNKPVARLVSATPQRETSQNGRLVRLESEGKVFRGDANKLDQLLKQPRIKPSSSHSALENLLEERKHGR